MKLAEKYLKLNRCFSGSEAVEKRVVATTLLKYKVFRQERKRDALGKKKERKKTFRGLLHDIGMSFVQERVHTGCHMIPE